jgi:glutamate synthase (NADPH/NADH) large chain
MGMVEFDPMEYEDVDRLHALIKKHYSLTGSEVALHILSHWRKALTQFVKVMPRDYKKALLKRKTTEWKTHQRKLG